MLTDAKNYTGAAARSAPMTKGCISAVTASDHTTLASQRVRPVFWEKRSSARMPFWAAIGLLASASTFLVPSSLPLAATNGNSAKSSPSAAQANNRDLLQLGLFGSKGDAEWAWLSLNRRQPALADKLSALIVPGPNGSGYALRAVVKDAGASGEGLCRDIIKGGQTCFVARSKSDAAPQNPPATTTARATGGFIPVPGVKPIVRSETMSPNSAAAVGGDNGGGATVTVVATPARTLESPVPVAATAPVPPPPAPVPAASDENLLAARTLDGFIRYSTDDAKVLAEIERRTRRRGRIGAVLPGGGLEVTPAILTQPEFNICALTFDDGPHRTVTRRILEILNQYKVVSTYFPVGNVAQRYPDIIRDFVASGHEIGNHSFTHSDMRPMKPDALRYEVAETNRILRSLGGASTLFRPPYGRYNPDLLQIVKDEGGQSVLWNVDTRDWKVRDPDKIVEHVATSAGSGSVLLLHSTYPTTADALPRVIATLREKNCEFVTLSEWLARMQAAGELPVTNAALPAPAHARLRN